MIMRCAAWQNNHDTAAWCCAVGLSLMAHHFLRVQNSCELVLRVSKETSAGDPSPPNLQNSMDP